MKKPSALLSLIIAAAAVLPSTLRAETAYALDSRSILLKFDTNSPGFIESSVVIRGLEPGESILGIDFRPANGALYGLGSRSRLYAIDPATGSAQPVGAGPFTPALNGGEFGFDFNPTVDRIRVVSNTGQNLRLHPDTGAVAATDLTLNADAVSRPNVIASAYTNSVASATTTVLYGIDSEQRSLVTQAPPNDGKLNRIGMLNIDLSALAGFDISPTTGVAYVAGRVGGVNASVLYQVNLTTGDSQLLGIFDKSDQISGLAIPNR